MTVDVKICGLRDETGVKATVESGARYAGFVFHARSKRYITPEDAGELAMHIPATVTRVGLFVDAGDDELRKVLRDVPLDLLQLHGSESPQRVAVIRAMTGLPVMKAMCVAAREDFAPLADFEAVADRILFDTKVGVEPTGGTGKSFDWTLLRGLKLTKPWMLAGGLRVENIADAIAVTGAETVDVSSGVEDATGRKDPAKIREFIRLANTLA